MPVVDAPIAVPTGEPAAMEEPLSRPRAVVPDIVPGPSEASLRILDPVADAVLSESSTSPEPYLVGVRVLDGETPPTEARSIEPLLRPGTQASTTRALVVTPDANGPVDVDRAVDALAARRALEGLPRRRSWRVSRDIIVLVDLGPGMDAFREDSDQLVAGLVRVAGSAAVRTAGFVGRPLPVLRRVGVFRATNVVVLTDLGESRLATPEERHRHRWIELADALDAAEARAVLLVPWERDRWPTEIRARLPLATWDRTSTVGDVLHAVRARG
jgi:hypothetical protein